MTTFQFFSLIQGLQMSVLSENFVLENAFEGGTIHSVFDPTAKVEKDVVPGSYIWIWADDNDDVEVINELIYQTLHIGESVVAEWIGWNEVADPRKHYILLVDKMIN